MKVDLSFYNGSTEEFANDLLSIISQGEVADCMRQMLFHYKDPEEIFKKFKINVKDRLEPKLGEAILDNVTEDMLYGSLGICGKASEILEVTLSILVGDKKPNKEEVAKLTKDITKYCEMINAE